VISAEAGRNTCSNACWRPPAPERLAPARSCNMRSSCFNGFARAAASTAFHAVKAGLLLSLFLLSVGSGRGGDGQGPGLAQLQAADSGDDEEGFDVVGEIESDALINMLEEAAAEMQPTAEEEEAMLRDMDGMDGALPPHMVRFRGTLRRLVEVL